MIDKYSATPLLLNLLSTIYTGKIRYLVFSYFITLYSDLLLIIICTAQCRHSEAEGTLKEALDKDPNNADTLINLFINSHFTGKPQEVSYRFLSQLKGAHPSHCFLQEYYKKDGEFDTVSLKFSKN